MLNVEVLISKLLKYIPNVSSRGSDGDIHVEIYLLRKFRFAVNNRSNITLNRYDDLDA